jgi:hypothetical protein
MRHRECMRHLVYMRTPVRVGVADGAIDVTSTVVGKVSELGHGEASLTLRSHAPEACANRASFRLGEPDASSLGAGLGRGLDLLSFTFSAQVLWLPHLGKGLSAGRLRRPDPY